MMPIVRPRKNPIVICPTSTIDALKKAGQTIPGNLYGSPYCPGGVAYIIETKPKVKPPVIPMVKWDGPILKQPNFISVSITA